MLVNPLSSGDSRKHTSGFTLPELLLVVALLSVVATIAVPRWGNSYQNHRIVQAANRVAADLARIQASAYSTGTAKTVQFAVDTSTYSVAGVSDLNRKSGSYVVLLNDTPYNATLVSVWGNAGTQTITFNGYGLPDKGGDIVVAVGSLRKTLTVNAVTGTVVIQ